MEESIYKDLKVCDFTGAVIINSYSDYIEAEFSEDAKKRTGFVRIGMHLDYICKLNDEEKKTELSGAEIVSLDFSPSGDGLDFKAVLKINDSETEYSFFSKVKYISVYRYHGFSYKNVYGETDFESSKKITSDEKWFRGSKEEQLCDDLKIEKRRYCYEITEEGNIISGHSYGTIRIFKNGKEILNHQNIDDQVNLKNPLIYHSNKRRYIAFKTGLYGISYIDPDSGEVYHYIPEGYSHDHNYLCGESFIVCEIYYSEKFDMVAYDGCYWAGPNEIMVGILDDPLNFNPHLFRVYEYVSDLLEEKSDDPEEFYLDDVWIDHWTDNGLMIKADSEGKTFSIEIPLETIKEKIKVLSDEDKNGYVER